MELALWGVKTPNELNWLTQPPPAHYAAASSLLQQLGLLLPNHQLSELGLASQDLGMSPRLAKMLLAAQHQSDEQQMLALDLAAILNEADLWVGEADADLIQRLLALQSYRKNSKQARLNLPIKVARVEQVLKNTEAWRRQLGFAEPVVLSLSKLQQTLGGCLALAFPDRIAQRRKGEAARYRLSNGKGAWLRDTDPLGQQAWLVVAELDGQRQEGQIFLAATLELSVIESVFKDQIRTDLSLRFDSKKRELVATEQRCLGKLVLTEKPTDAISSEAFQAALLKILAEQLDLLPWSEVALDYLKRLRWLANFQPDWPSFDQAWLTANIQDWLAPYLTGMVSVRGLQGLNMLAMVQSLLSYEQQQVLAQEAPQFYHAPSDKKVTIDYSQPNTAKVSLQLQEVFGELSSPRLAWGQVALTFELLSPARRPIQTTADLAHFWRHSYFEVAKEMRGRYPKHRWPDKPLDEKPGRSIKAKS
ncbi:ATP-dependent helicase C-terminal domain-containing protein [Thiomicrospira microaerophila]|uniref:ATP-dependent helicase C-terminal domain-containing protein n=1 Tax=Thiomicrospira microaerophila TaxID=406020 RepID=UPI00200FBE54|nr:ATP-dependent helicase C-terminal domain-containing protein [Thiomicrospira microaerophila]